MKWEFMDYVKFLMLVMIGNFIAYMLFLIVAFVFGFVIGMTG